MTMVVIPVFYSTLDSLAATVAATWKWFWPQGMAQ